MNLSTTSIGFSILFSSKQIGNEILLRKRFFNVPLHKMLLWVTLRNDWYLHAGYFCGITFTHMHLRAFEQDFTNVWKKLTYGWETERRLKYHSKSINSATVTPFWQWLDFLKAKIFIVCLELPPASLKISPLEKIYWRNYIYIYIFYLFHR